MPGRDGTGWDKDPDGVNSSRFGCGGGVGKVQGGCGG